MSIKSSLPHWTLVKQLPCGRNFRKSSIIFEDKCTFLSFFNFLLDDFDMDSHDFDFGTLSKKANAKGSLHKTLDQIWHEIGANPPVIDTKRTAKQIQFFICYSRFNKFVL